jgi:hypothetical protein
MFMKLASRTTRRRTAASLEHSLLSRLSGDEHSIHLHMPVAFSESGQAIRSPTRETHKVSRDSDSAFQQSILNVIATSRRWLFESPQKGMDKWVSRGLLDAGTDGIRVLSKTGGIEYINDSGLHALYIRTSRR